MSRAYLQCIVAGADGRAYLRHLHSLADEYAAIMIALAVTPQEIVRAKNAGAHYKRRLSRAERAAPPPTPAPLTPPPHHDKAD